jgi:hypothetical protein
MAGTASGPAAPGVVVPESRPAPTRKSGLADGLPAAVTESGPGLITGYPGEKAEDLGVASRAVAPAIAVALDELGPAGWIGARDEEAVRAGLVPAHYVRRPGQRHLDHVLLADCLAYRSQCVHDPESAMCYVVGAGPTTAVPPS